MPAADNRPSRGSGARRAGGSRPSGRSQGGGRSSEGGGPARGGSSRRSSAEGATTGGTSGRPSAGGRSGGGAARGRSSGAGPARDDSSSGGGAGGRRDSARGPGRGAGDRRAGGQRSSDGGAPRKYTKNARRSAGDDEAIPGNQAWGGLARKGALRATHDEKREYDEKQQRRRGDDELDPAELAKREEREERRAARDVRQTQLRAEAKAAVDRINAGAPSAPRRRSRAKAPLDRRSLPGGPARSGDESEALLRLLGAAEAKKQLRRLRSAAESYEAERFAEARKMLKPLAELAPGVAEVRELYGLTLYRMGKYRDAARELEEFRVLAATTEQNPVLMDCYRAQQRWADVAVLWDELAEASPSAGVVSEGRIVMASALADQGEVDAALRMLEKGWKRPSRPFDHHLRRAYALADLYERSGDLPRARALFEWLAAKDGDFVDVRARVRSLR